MEKSALAERQLDVAALTTAAQIQASPDRSQNAFMSRIQDVYIAFAERRAALNLPYPGTVDNISREVTRDTFLTNLMFTGFRADLSKMFSNSPFFSVAHNLTIGGGQGLPPYGLAALYGNPRIFMQGNIDNEGQLSGRFNYRWTSAIVSRLNAQAAPGGNAMMTVETEYTGADFSSSIKALSPSILEGCLTGQFTGSYLQSITPRFALGGEALWQKISAGEAPQVAMSYAARYRGSDWVASGSLVAQGVLQAAYWRRLSDKIQAGVELQLQLGGLTGGGGGMMGGMRNEGVATIGAKYDFTTSTYRGQIDSTGKVQCLLEKRLAQAASLTFAGEIDHSKNSARIGLALTVEAAPEELMQQQEMSATSGQDTQPPPF